MQESHAKAVTAINPYYYRYYRCHQGKITELALHWLSDSDREKLLKTLHGFSSTK
jgi:hypothetical protein